MGRVFKAQWALALRVDLEVVPWQAQLNTVVWSFSPTPMFCFYTLHKHFHCSRDELLQLTELVFGCEMWSLDILLNTSHLSSQFSHRCFYGAWEWKDGWRVCVHIHRHASTRVKVHKNTGQDIEGRKSHSAAIYFPSIKGSRLRDSGLNRTGADFQGSVTPMLYLKKTNWNVQENINVVSYFKHALLQEWTKPL